MHLLRIGPAFALVVPISIFVVVTIVETRVGLGALIYRISPIRRWIDLSRLLPELGLLGLVRTERIHSALLAGSLEGSLVDSVEARAPVGSLISKAAISRGCLGAAR